MTYLIVQLTNDELLCARFQRRRGELVFLAGGRQDLDPARPFTATLAELAGARREEEKIILALPSTQIFLRELDLPISDRRKARQVLDVLPVDASPPKHDHNAERAHVHERVDRQVEAERDKAECCDGPRDKFHLPGGVSHDCQPGEGVDKSTEIQLPEGDHKSCIDRQQQQEVQLAAARLRALVEGLVLGLARPRLLVDQPGGSASSVPAFFKGLALRTAHLALVERGERGDRDERRTGPTTDDAPERTQPGSRRAPAHRLRNR